MGNFPFSFCPWNGSKCIHFSSANTHTHLESTLLKSAATNFLFSYLQPWELQPAKQMRNPPWQALTLLLCQKVWLLWGTRICEIYHSRNDYFLVIFRCTELNVKETDNHETKEITHRIKSLLLVSWNSYWYQQRWTRIMIAILF